MRRAVPPKVVATAGGSGKGAAGPAKAAVGGKKPYQRAETISTGEILTDLTGKKFRIGNSVGVGGFGEIYLASDDVSKPATEKNSLFVAKIEPHSNGPLFVEIAAYLRMARLEMIEEWKKANKVENLGMPHYVASGSHLCKSVNYRWMVIPRYGDDLHKIIQSKPTKKLSSRCVQAIALQIIDILEYIHSREFVHGDIKASNLLVSLDIKKQQINLLDFGLGQKFVENNGEHQAYGTDKRKAHNGTLEYASRDAHVGAFSRRGDLEVLGYNMLEWLCGTLPWSRSDTPINVSKQKTAFMNSVQLNRIYPGDIPGLDICEKFLRYIGDLAFDQKPNYNKCREILRRGLPNKVTSLYLEDNSVIPTKKKRSSNPTTSGSQEKLEVEPVVTKKIKVPEEEGIKRNTRTTKKVKNFNWTRVLSSNPEEIIRAATQNNSVATSPEPKISPTFGIPTPAMLQILSKKKENLQNNVTVRTPSASDLLDTPGPVRLTEAMKEVLLKTKKKKLRKSLSMGELPLPAALQLKKPTFRAPSPAAPRVNAPSTSSRVESKSSRHARHLRRNP